MLLDAGFELREKALLRGHVLVRGLSLILYQGWLFLQLL
jgi:hypothetical protein